MARRRSSPTTAGLAALMLPTALALAAAPAHADIPILECDLANGDRIACGGEGERACGLLTDPFWANGTGFCDHGLEAAIFPGFDPIPAFRGNAYVQFNDVDLVQIRERIQQISARADELAASANTIGDRFRDIDSAGDFFARAWSWAAPSVDCSTSCLDDCGSFPLCVEVHADPTDNCLTVPIIDCDVDILPQMHHDFVALIGDAATLVGSSVLILGDVAIALSEVGVTLPIVELQPPSPSLDFGHCVRTLAFDFELEDLDEIPSNIEDIAAGRVPGYLRDIVNACLTPVIDDAIRVSEDVQDYLALAREIFDDPSAVCRNNVRRDFDGEPHLEPNGEFVRDTNGFWLLSIGDQSFEGDVNRGDGVGDVTEFRATWAYYAGRAQWELARREPLNWGQIVETHNAYNNIADGFLFPNQRYSITDQLDLGVRWIELDPNFIPTPVLPGIIEAPAHLRVCHGKDDIHLGCAIWDRLADNALQEIRAWLDAHPDEVIFLRLEDYFDALTCSDGKAAEFAALLSTTFGSRIHERDIDEVFTPMPSRDALLAAGKQVIVLSDSNPEVSPMSYNPQQQESGDFFRDDATRPQCSDRFFLASGVNQHGELLDAEGDVVEYDVCGVTCRMRVTTDGGEIERSLVAGCGSALLASECTPTPCAVPDGCEYDPTQLKDRDYLLPGEIGRVYESRTLIDALGNLESGRDLLVLNEPEAEQLAQCFVSLVGFDYVHAKEDSPRNICIDQQLDLDTCRSPDRRLEALVWSFAPNEYGQSGDAFYLGADRRWHSGDEEGARPAACALTRRGDPATWADKAGGDWALTTCEGTWEDAAERCWREFGAERELGAPKNGWMNARLADKMFTSGIGEAWIDVNDRAVEGRPHDDVAPTVTGSDLPAQGTHFEGSPIDFAADGFDPEGSPLTFKWTFGDTPRTSLCDLEDPPPAYGPVTRHTYGDNGPVASRWPVTLLGRDRDGGIDARAIEVTVLNVAPSAALDHLVDETGDLIGVDVPFAYAGLPTTLIGSFTDPGWLDTHVGTVAWGDGATGPLLVDQRAGSGDVSGVHDFPAPGDFVVRITVRDDDGGVGGDARDLHVLDAGGVLAHVAAELAGSGASRVLKWIAAAIAQFDRDNVEPFFQHIEQALAAMEDTGVGTPAQQKMLAMAAKSHAALQVAQAVAAQSTERAAERIEAARADLAAGDVLRGLGDYANAVGLYREAARLVQGIAR